MPEAVLTAPGCCAAVGGCGPKPKAGCDETARETKAGAIKALLAQGALGSSPLYANGTALKVRPETA